MHKGSSVSASDNSGIVLAKVIQKYQHRLNPIGVRCLAVLRAFDPFKKQLQKKRKYGALIIAAKQAIKRKNGAVIRFNSNRALFFVDIECDKFLGTRVFGPAGREVTLSGLNAAIRQKVGVGCIVM